MKNAQKINKAILAFEKLEPTLLVKSLQMSSEKLDLAIAETEKNLNELLTNK